MPHPAPADPRGRASPPPHPPPQTLDADRVRLVDSNRRSAVRDTVQFVQFSKHRNDGVALATELLAELPGQFLEWVRCVCVNQRCGLGGLLGGPGNSWSGSGVCV